MPLGTSPCKTAILQGQILAMHSSDAVGLYAYQSLLDAGSAGESRQRQRRTSFLRITTPLGVLHNRITTPFQGKHRTLPGA
jgi:hypothetical protein